MSDAGKTETVCIEVAYATPERQKIVVLDVPVSATLIESVRLSKITDIFTELDIENADVGVWGKVQPKTTTVEEGMRIEIYRPLIADPKESRRKRAAKKPLKKVTRREVSKKEAPKREAPKKDASKDS